MDGQGIKIYDQHKIEQKVTIVNLQSNAGGNVGDSYRLLRFYSVHGCITFKHFSSNNISLYPQPAGVLSYKILSNIFLKLIVMLVI